MKKSVTPMPDETSKSFNQNEKRIAALRAAINEGESSGYVEDFDFESHLCSLSENKGGEH